MPETITIDIQACFECGDWYKTFRSGPRNHCSNCGAPLAHQVFDLDKPKPTVPPTKK